MRGWRALAVTVLCAAAAACAAARPAGQPETAPSEGGVEVVNMSHETVKIYHYVRGSSSGAYLGSVAAGGRRTFRVPPSWAGGISARTNNGRFVSSPHVRIHHIRL